MNGMSEEVPVLRLHCACGTGSLTRIGHGLTSVTPRRPTTSRPRALRSIFSQSDHTPNGGRRGEPQNRTDSQGRTHTRLAGDIPRNVWRVQSLERAPSWQPDPKWKRAESAITLGFTGRKNPALERRSRMAQKSCARRRHGPSAGRPGQCGTDSGRARRVHLNHPGLQACGPGVRWPWPSGAGRRRAASAAFFCWILGRPGACKSGFFGFARAFLCKNLLSVMKAAIISHTPVWSGYFGSAKRGFG